MSRGNDLHVYLDGRFVGVASQRNGSTSFHYDTSYLASEDPTVLSLAMPLRERPFSNKVVNAWLEGLLPDSEATRRRWARQYSASPNNPFSLLRHVGLDAAGAVQILPPDVEPPDAALRTGTVDWLGQDAFHNVLRELATHGTDWNPGIYQGRWSLAGAQAKIALHGRKASEGGDYTWGVPLDSTPTTHIVKPSIAGSTTITSTKRCACWPRRRSASLQPLPNSSTTTGSRPSSPRVTTGTLTTPAYGDDCTKKTCARPCRSTRARSTKAMADPGLGRSPTSSCDLTTRTGSTRSNSSSRTWRSTP